MNISHLLQDLVPESAARPIGKIPGVLGDSFVKSFHGALSVTHSRLLRRDYEARERIGVDEDPRLVECFACTKDREIQYELTVHDSKTFTVSSSPLSRI